MRIPKLRGFKNRFKIDFEVVNVGAIAAAAERGAFEGGEVPGAATKPKKAAPVTVNQELLRAVGLVRTLKKPLKILGNGELTTALFVVADAFSKSAVTKIEAAGGTISVLEVPTEELVALGLTDAPPREPRQARTAEGRAAATRKVDDRAARATRAADNAAEAAATSAAKADKPAKAPKAPKASADAVEAPAAEATEAPAAEAPAADATDETETAAGIVTADEPAGADDAPETAEATLEDESPVDGENA
jgi:ribosomal protein L15